MSEVTEEKQEKKLRQVRALLERADHPSTPREEADSARTMAESLMLKYRLEEALVVQKGDTSVVPVWRKMDLVVADSEFATFYHKLAGIVMQHVGAKGVTGWRENEEGRFVSTLEWVGYSMDLNAGEMLLTACMMEFGKRLEPKYDSSLSDAENAFNLRSAGWERKRIAVELFGQWETINEMKAKNRKVTRLIREHAAQIGEDADSLLGRGTNIKSYREDYANGFVSAFHLRLIRMRNAAGEEGSGIVLRSKFENVLEAYYTRFPQYRPSDEPWRDPREGCEKCKKSKSGYCRDHGFLKPSKAQARGRYVNTTARSRGQMAAAMVDLGPNASGRGRAPASPTRGEL